MNITLKEKYHIKFDENLVEILKDDGPPVITRIESRFMEVLKILVDNKGRVVSRETIVEKVWDNYGGGDEGLTQAVSYLRKIFDDRNRTLIETIPKKGYKLNYVELNQNELNNAAAGKYELGNEVFFDRRLIFTGITVISLLIVLFVYSKISMNNNIDFSPTPKATSPDRHLNYDSTSFAPKADVK